MENDYSLLSTLYSLLSTYSEMKSSESVSQSIHKDDISGCIISLLIGFLLLLQLYLTFVSRFGNGDKWRAKVSNTNRVTSSADSLDEAVVSTIDEQSTVEARSDEKDVVDVNIIKSRKTSFPRMNEYCVIIKPRVSKEEEEGSVAEENSSIM